MKPSLTTRIFLTLLLVAVTFGSIGGILYLVGWRPVAEPVWVDTQLPTLPEP